MHINKIAENKRTSEQTSKWIGVTSKKAVSLVGPLPSSILAIPIVPAEMKFG